MILKEAISRKKWCVVGLGDDGKGVDPHKGGCENIRTGHDSPLYTCCRQMKKKAKIRMRMTTRIMKLNRQIRGRQGSPPSVLDKAMFRPPAHFEEVACGRSHSFHQHYLIVGPTYDGIGTWCTYFLQPNSIQRRSLMSLQEGSG